MNARSRNSRAIEIASLVKRDYLAVAGRVVLLKAVTASSGDRDNITLELDPPLEFKVSAKVPDGELTRVCDEWVDPTYDVEPLNPKDPQLAGWEAFFCYGVSYHLYEDSTEPGDVVHTDTGGPVVNQIFSVPYSLRIDGVIQVAAPDSATAEAVVRGYGNPELINAGRNSMRTFGAAVVRP